jgi:YD repeat-containing protein
MHDVPVQLAEHQQELQQLDPLDTAAQAIYSYFDGDGQVTKTVDGDGHTAYSHYDADGNVTKTIDGRSHAAYSYFDNNGNATQTVDEDGYPGH